MAPENRVIAKPLPALTRLSYFIRLWGFKALVNAFIFTRTYIIKPPRSVRPTYTKVYSVRPEVTCRIFVPKSYKPGSAPLPLFIDIHGGGFAIGAPLFDDGDNTILANDHGFCVVAIGYKLAPSHPYPTGPQDCAALIQAVLDDRDLPVDKSKVVVGGYSAGGNLSLAATQLNGLNKKINAVVAYYPCTTFVDSVDAKLAVSTPPPGKKDMLSNTARWFDWAYVNPGQDKADPVLSPHEAARDALPEKLYLLGCEYDMLCLEAQQTAEKMAEAEKGEKVADSDGNGWTRGNVRWRKIMGVEHGFNQTMDLPKEKREKLRADMHADVARWLEKEVFV